MSSSLFEKLLTLDDLNTLSEEVTLLQTSIFQVKENAFESALSSSVRTWVGEYITREINEQKLDRKQYLKDLLTQIKDTKILKLVIGFQPTPQNITEVANWVKKDLGPEVVIDLSYQPDLIGGAVVTWQGKFFESSVKQKFTQYIPTAMAKIFNSKTTESLEQPINVTGAIT
jgi:hypothetical protein